MRLGKTFTQSQYKVAQPLKKISFHYICEILTLISGELYKQSQQ